MKNSLSIIDTKLQKAANELGATLTKNDDKGMWLPTDFEERSIEWSDRNMEFLIQIFPTIENNKIKNWNFWVAATYDKDKKRFWKQKKLVDSGTKTGIIKNINDLLDNSKFFFRNLTIDELIYVTNVN